MLFLRTVEKKTVCLAQLYPQQAFIHLTYSDRSLNFLDQQLSLPLTPAGLYPQYFFLLKRFGKTC